MNKRRYTKATDWLPVLTEWQQSCLSKKSFCEQKGIHYKLFYRWYNKLMQAEAKPAKLASLIKSVTPAFILVEITPTPQTRHQPSACTLQVGSHWQPQISLSALNRDFLSALI